MFPPKRIAFLSYSDAKGGLEINIVRLAKECVKRGFEVLILGKEESPTAQMAKAEGLPFQVIKIRNKRLDIIAASDLVRILKKQGFQNLVSATSQHNYIGAYAKAFFFKGLKLLYYQQMQLGGSKKGLLQTWVCGQLDYWLAPLNGLAEQAKEWTNIDHEKVHIMPLGIDYPHYADFDMSSQEAKALLGLPTNVPIIGIIGRLDPLKNQLLVLEAMSKLQREATLVILGEQTLDNPEGYRLEVKTAIQENRLSECVVLRGFEKDVRPYLKAFDVLVMATSKETYGMVTLEAMAAGTSVVGANGGGTPELLDNGACGYLFEPGNAPSLAMAIELGLSDEARILKARASQQRAKALYSFEQAMLIFSPLID